MHPAGLHPERDTTSVCAGQRPVVGLPGLEPGTSSLSASARQALCGPASSQVARDRQGRSNALYAGSRGRSFAAILCPEARSIAGGVRDPIVGPLRPGLVGAEAADTHHYRGYALSWLQAGERVEWSEHYGMQPPDGEVANRPCHDFFE